MMTNEQLKQFTNSGFSWADEMAKELIALREEKKLRKFGPKSSVDAGISGINKQICPACKKRFKEGDYSTLISFGPGDDPEAQEKCRTGKAYNAIAAEVHWACATGEV